MRKTVTFDRIVRVMNPVWHQQEAKSSYKNQTMYKRPMVILDLIPGKEYNCDELQALLNRGAVIDNADYTYICSHGFIPISEGELMPISEVSTGLDPEGELN